MVVISELSRRYLDWAYEICNDLEGDTLKEYSKDFINKQTKENISEVLGVEVSEKDAAIFREKISVVQNKLMAYCCGTPILYFFDKEVQNTMDNALDELFRSLNVTA